MHHRLVGQDQTAILQRGLNIAGDIHEDVVIALLPL